MYQALYRKWRPTTFEEMVGQPHITRTLLRQVESGRLSHAYLFTGTRGTGKTTSAKILAKAINCQHPVGGNPCNQCTTCQGIHDGSILDVLELDAASNNGVDQMRALREEAVYSPVAAKKRVYIIDEVHSLSTPAFNALLKILEEPPPHLLFILATTELHKVPATIRSRCQQFSFQRILPTVIEAHLSQVAKEEGISLTQEGAVLLSRLADGGLRDALSLLDQCRDSEKVDEAHIYQVMGLAGNVDTARMMEFIAQRQTESALLLLGELYQKGRDIGGVLEEMSTLTRDLLLLKTAPRNGVSLLTGGYDNATLARLGEMLPPAQLVYTLTKLQDTVADLSKSKNRRTDGELCLMRLCQPDWDTNIMALSARLSRLEAGMTVPVPQPVPQVALPVMAPVAVAEVTPPAEVTPEPEREAIPPVEVTPEPEREEPPVLDVVSEETTLKVEGEDAPVAEQSTEDTLEKEEPSPTEEPSPEEEAPTSIVPEMETESQETTGEVVENAVIPEENPVEPPSLDPTFLVTPPPEMVAESENSWTEDNPPPPWMDEPPPEEPDWEGTFEPEVPPEEQLAPPVPQMAPPVPQMVQPVPQMAQPVPQMAQPVPQMAPAGGNPPVGDFWPAFSEGLKGRINKAGIPYLTNPEKVVGRFTEGNLVLWVNTNFTKALIDRPYITEALVEIAKEHFQQPVGLQFRIGTPPPLEIPAMQAVPMMAQPIPVQPMVGMPQGTMMAAPPVPTAPVMAEAPPVPTAPVMAEAPPVPTEAAREEMPPVPTAPVMAEAPPVPTAPVMAEAPPVPTAPAMAEAPPVPTAPVMVEAPPVPTEAAREEVPPVPTETVDESTTIEELAEDEDDPLNDLMALEEELKDEKEN